MNAPVATGHCGCWIGAWYGVTPPPRCVAHGGIPTTTGASTGVPFFGSIVFENGISRCGSGCAFLPCMHFPNWIDYSSKLGPNDVERIARRVVELLKAS